MDNYNNQESLRKNPLYFRRRVEKGGWLAADREISRAESAWISEFERIPSWLAQAYNDDIFAFNGEAQELWVKLRKGYPEIFSDVVLKDGILRLYSDADHLGWAQHRHRRIGAEYHALDPGQVASRFPALGKAAVRKAFAGALVVPGSHAKRA